MSAGNRKAEASIIAISIPPRQDPCGIDRHDHAKWIWRRTPDRAIQPPQPNKVKPMRRLVTAVATLTMLSVQPVLAERQCTSLSDQSTFEVQALRSELMVLATGCNDGERYNAFIRRFQSDLQSNERAINAYFQHRYGRSAQAEHDKFVTDLANAVSRHGSDLGGDFCPRNGMIFNEVLALDSPSELEDFAAGKNLVPATVDICAPTPSSSAKVRKTAAAAPKKK
jgi:hypothetical protein